MKPGPRLIGPLYRPVDPTTLVGVASDGSRGDAYRLTQSTAVAARALILAAEAEGHAIGIASGYRTPEHQERLFARAVAKYGSEKDARRWVAKFSEHATGQTIDWNLGIQNSSENASSGAFAALPAWQWLAEHAPKMGWTPYEREPWHWTFNPVS
ncbi:MAG: D-alanyl-D-alanine carboxypeptidase family protein [Nitrospira sp.]|nr:D-alanyl-D-alanine carboxypeptidase family protein [Nitrospira sp.]